MKKLLMTGVAFVALSSGAAMAADLSRPPPAAPAYTKAPPMMPLFSWTGCYVGANGGGIFTHTEVTEVATGLSNGSVDFNGGVFGGQVGCNYQISNWVFGVQGDWDWSSAKGTFNDLITPGLTDGDKVKSLASVTGRLGYAWDRFLIYAKGGGAWESNDYTASIPGLSVTLNDTRTGWTVGGGGEYAFTDWLTGFVEYDFYDFGTKNETLAGIPAVLGSNIKEHSSVAKVGLNVKFGGWH
jgi:outer membrane immunogenic protein